MRAGTVSIASLMLGLTCLLIALGHKWGWDAFGWVLMMGLLFCLQAGAGALVLGGKHGARPFSILGLAWMLSLALTLAAGYWAFDHARGC